MRLTRRDLLAMTLLGTVLPPGVVRAYPRATDAVDEDYRVSVAELAAALSGPAADRPRILQVGALSLYKRAHIPGAVYAGMASTAEGLARLGRVLTPIGRTAPVVVYCGCCPWTHCANVAPALGLLRERGYTAGRVLYLPSDFTTDWVDTGHSVAADA